MSSENGLHLGRCATVALWLVACCFDRSSWTAAVVTCWYSSRLSSLREVAIDLFQAIAPNTFLREVPLAITVSSFATGADADLSSCEFLTVRATPFNASYCRPRSLLVEMAASTVTYELAQTGGISSCRGATPIEQPNRISCVI